jgi:hypothetical protein
LLLLCFDLFLFDDDMYLLLGLSLLLVLVLVLLVFVCFEFNLFLKKLSYENKVCGSFVKDDLLIVENVFLELFNKDVSVL